MFLKQTVFIFRYYINADCQIAADSSPQSVHRRWRLFAAGSSDDWRR